MSSTAHTWHPDPQQLAAHAGGRLPPAETKKLQAHLDECPACRQELGRLLPGGASLCGQETTPPSEVAEVAARQQREMKMPNWQESAVPAGLSNHPKFEILKLVGQGGMGAVYKARHKVMDRIVALKIINAQLVGNEKAVERFRREVQAAAKLHHANIVTAFDADQAGDTHFLVMEFVEGTDLARYVEQEGPLPVPRACDFIRQAAQALQHAHEQGMVHRDIKPHNLMLTSRGVVKVMDFGLARLAHTEVSGAGLTGENVLMGTADYIAPEQAEDAHRADIRADIYSLGCSLYHLLAGKPPFEGGTVVQKIMAHANSAVRLAALPKSVPEDLRAILAKMLAKNPAQRYQTPEEVAQALASVMKSEGVELSSMQPADAQVDRTVADASAEPTWERNLKRKRRLPMPIWFGVGAVAAAVLIGAILVISGRQPAHGPVSANHDAGRSGTAVVAVLPPTFENSVGMEFVLVPRGRSWLGGGNGTAGDQEVEILHDFYLGKYEVTQQEWQTIMNGNPSHFSRDGAGNVAVIDLGEAELKRLPVEQVSWDDAQLFLQKLNSRETNTGWTYRLPTEREWECACRGMAADKADCAFDFYVERSSNTLLLEQANFTPSESKSLQRTCKVGSYPPNRLGLHDMHANVWEWCDDAQKTADGVLLRVIRGGGWNTDSGDCRAAFRHAYPPSLRFNSIGLRVARVPAGRRP